MAGLCAQLGSAALMFPTDLVDDGLEVRVLVQQHLPDEVLVGQLLLAQVEVRDVPHTLEGARRLDVGGKQLLRLARVQNKGADWHQTYCLQSARG